MYEAPVPLVEYSRFLCRLMVEWHIWYIGTCNLYLRNDLITVYSAINSGANVFLTDEIIFDDGQRFLLDINMSVVYVWNANICTFYIVTFLLLKEKEDTVTKNSL